MEERATVFIPISAWAGIDLDRNISINSERRPGSIYR